MANTAGDACSAAKISRVIPGYERLDDEIFGGEESDEDFYGFDSSGSVDEEESDVIEPSKWKTGNRVPIIPKFIGKTGILVDLPEGATELDYWNLFMTDEVMEELSKETNRYAAEFLQNNRGKLKPNSRFHRWTDTSPSEMKAFVALLFAMGLTKQRDIQQYWTTDEVTCTPFYSTVMPRDRFLILLTFLHFNDNNNYVLRGRDGYDPLFKLGKVYHIITEAFPKSFYPSREIAIEERLLASCGNVHIRVYNPDTPDTFCIKSYELRDAKTGYCCKYELYTGKRSNTSEHGSTYDMCMRLMQPYLNRGHCLYVDHFYTSPTLFWELFKCQTGACGTLHLDRKLVPKEFKDAKPNKGKTMAMSNGPLTLVKYHDKCLVSLCTTIHTSNIMGKESNRKPECVREYNKYMGAVDKSDQVISYDCFKRRKFKWYKKVMFHLFDLAELQAYLIYKESTPKPVLHRVFRCELVKKLVAASGLCKPPNRGRPRKSAEVLQRLEGRHFPSKIVGKGKKLNITRSCEVCTPSDRLWYKSHNLPVPKRPGHESSYQCKECDATLCVEPCFRLYHTTQEYIPAYRRWKESHDRDSNQ